LAQVRKIYQIKCVSQLSLKICKKQNDDKPRRLDCQKNKGTKRIETHRDFKKMCTGGPPYMREIGTPKICSNIMNSNIKRLTITVN